MTCGACKLMEKLVVNRLIWYIEKHSNKVSLDFENTESLSSICAIYNNIFNLFFTFRRHTTLRRVQNNACADEFEHKKPISTVYQEFSFKPYV